MNTLYVLGALSVVVLVFIVWEMLSYRRDTYRVVCALKEGREVRGLELVKKHRVSRAHVYVILSSLERRGHVRRRGDKAPYLYKWKET